MRYNEASFTNSCNETNQKFNYCGVGVHHQNGIAEDKNKTLAYGSKNIFLHAKRRWSKVINSSLLPYSMLATVKTHNELSLSEDGEFPLERFTGIKDEITCSDWHTWGCPCFMLAEENQSGLTGTPKWEPRARTGVYLGNSPTHAGNVALVLNLLTGHVSPQYHVAFDDEFTLVEYLDSTDTPPSWSNIYQNSSEKVTDEQYDRARTWYEGNKGTEEVPDEDLDNIDDVDIEYEQTREPLIPNVKQHEKTREPLIPNAKEYEKTREQYVSESSLSKKTREQRTNEVSSNVKPTNAQPFVDIASVGLRREKRIKTPSQILRHPSEIKKRTKNEYYGLLLMAYAFLSSIENSVQEIYNTSSCSAYGSYDDFLE